MHRHSLYADRVLTPFIALGLMIGIGVAAATREQTADVLSPALRTFADRVKGYVQLRNRLDSELPQPAMGDSEAVEAHRKAIVQAIQRARAKARAGDMFSPFVADALRSIIKTEFRNRPPEDFYDMIKDIPRAGRLNVNQPYPAGAPRATIPPLLIAKLPPLPPDVAYSFIGRALILRDVEADLVVDFVEKALPTRP